jgi:hypothetical protein
MGRAVDVVSCYEAGYDGFWLHRQLEAHGVRNYVIDPASLQVDRRARRVKTDRIDAERLLRSLMAYRRGEPKVWSVVRVSGIVEEDARRLHRECDRLVSERVQHVNRITGLCALHGIYDYHTLRHRLAPRQTQDAEAHAAAAELMRSESGRHDTTDPFQSTAERGRGDAARRPAGGFSLQAPREFVGDNRIERQAGGDVETRKLTGPLGTRTAWSGTLIAVAGGPQIA